MNHLYRQHGVKGESYHMRKFSGRPLQQIKKSVATIFSNAKTVVKKHVQKEVSDAKIDELCIKVIKLLTAPYSFFEALLQDDSIDNHINNADIKKKN